MAAQEATNGQSRQRNHRSGSTTKASPTPAATAWRRPDGDSSTDNIQHPTSNIIIIIIIINAIINNINHISESL